MKLILLGPPGAGKGTQGEILSRELGIPTISTGNILRAAIKNGTQVGQVAKGYIDKGELVPDEVIIAIIKERLAQDDCSKGYILDGVPRTVAQAEAMEKMGVDLDAVLLMKTSDDTIVKRMSGRRVCPNCSKTYHTLHNPPAVEGKCDACDTALERRKDDEPEVVLTRLENYHKETEPLVQFYEKRRKLIPVEELSNIQQTTAVILKKLGL